MKTTIFITTALILSSISVQAEKFNANIFFPDKHPLSKHNYIEWAEDVKKRTDGGLEPVVYAGTVLLPPRSGLSGVRDGIANVGYHAGTYTPAELPISNAIQELGFNYTDPLIASIAVTDFNMNNSQALAQWKKAGIVFGGGYSTPPYNLMCREKVDTVSDLKGKRLRTPGAAFSVWAESVGAVPVNVPSSEMYQGLEKGTLDCAVNVASDMKSRSLWDVAKFTNMVPLGLYWAGPMWGYNQKFWNNLSETNRRSLLDSHALAMARTFVGYQKTIDEAVDEAKSHGVKVVAPDAKFLSSIEEFAKSNRARAEKVAIDKHGLKDVKEIMDDFNAVMEKWQGKMAEVDRKDTSAISALIKSELFDKIDVKAYGK